MARNKKILTDDIPQQSADGVEPILIEDELEDSYLEYALSVIVSRAIPDARDGLKPVHRRLIYAMWKAGMRSDRPHRKSVGAVGETMKTAHPHGDQSLYETLVRLAQPWSMRVPLVDGHGNFGSRDHGPAAARYTEARLDPAAEALLANVNEQTVDTVANFDDSLQLPKVLPAAFPNLLVNGVQGIAVGISTSIPPHNLEEIAAACVELIDNPNATTKDLRRHVTGPDFPTGGTCFGEGINEMYETGRGKFTLRARARIEQIAPRRQGIVVSELPYGVGPEKVVADVKSAVSAGKIEGITDIVDLSDRKHGLRLTVEVRPSADPEQVLALLYRHTALQTTFSANMVALVDDRPTTCNLLDLCRVFVEHRVEVIRRRTEFRLEQAVSRAHILEGLLCALDAIEVVIELIRSSKDTAAARAALMTKLKLSQEQADHILEMPLRRLTSLEARRLTDELKALKKDIAGFRKILKSRNSTAQVVKNELVESASEFQHARSTKVMKSAPAEPAPAPERTSRDQEAKAEAATEPVEVIFDEVNVWRSTKSKGKKAAVVGSVQTTTTSTLLIVTSDAHVVPLHVNELAVDGTPTPLAAFADLSDRELCSIVDVTGHLALVTRSGVVKRVAVPTLPSEAVVDRAGRDGIPVMSVKDDVLAAAFNVAEESDVISVVASNGQLLRFDASSVRPQGRPAGGVAGMKLPDDAHVVTATSEEEAADRTVAIITDGGNLKASRLSDYPKKGRSTGGVRAVTFKKADTAVSSAVITDSTWAAVSASKKVISSTIETSRRDSSGVETPGASAVSQVR